MIYAKPMMAGILIVPLQLQLTAGSLSPTSPKIDPRTPPSYYQGGNSNLDVSPSPFPFVSLRSPRNAAG